MGRPRKPTSLKILDRDRPDRISTDEPSAPPGIGDPPDWLDRFGREAWAALAGHHAGTGLLTRLDVALVTLYCQSYSGYRHALATISADLAAECDAPERRRPPHPMFRVVNQAHKQMVQALSKLGMSPSDRAGLHVRETPGADPLMRYLHDRKSVPDGGPKKAR